MLLAGKNAVVAGIGSLQGAGALTPVPATPKESAGRIMILTDGAGNVGTTTDAAIARVRRLRPGSVETDEQAEATHVADAFVAIRQFAQTGDPQAKDEWERLATIAKTDNPALGDAMLRSANRLSIAQAVKPAAASG